jgi:hypothetical protein
VDSVLGERGDVQRDVMCVHKRVAPGGGHSASGPDEDLEGNRDIGAVHSEGEGRTLSTFVVIIVILIGMRGESSVTVLGVWELKGPT